MYVVGLTGGIGSGKSTVADLFAELGVAVIDTDRIAHQLTAPGGEALNAIRKAFSDSVMNTDGALDRAALRHIVFSDLGARKQLEGILHPLIRRDVAHALASLSTAYAVVVIPLLVETGGYRNMLSRVLVVDCTEALQIERVMSRSQLTRDEVDAILAAQASRAQRLAVADDVIVNSTAQSALRAEVAALHQRYLRLSVAPLP